MSDPEAPRTAPRGKRFDPIPGWAGVGTRVVHVGRLPDLNAGAIAPPIYQTSTYRYPAEFSEAAAGGHVHLYTRITNPSFEGPTEVLRDLEGGEEARLFASGMGATSAVLLSLLRSGDEVVALQDLYGGTTDILHDLAPRFGIRVREVSASEAAEPERLVPRGTRLVWLESPTNPTLRVIDLRRWSDASDAAGAVLVVDNTFATPVNQTPIALGADLVVHSATKYLGGHSDLVAGAVIGASALMDRIDSKSFLGAPIDPFAAYLLGRSLKTLALRMARHNENGARVAEALSHHPDVEKVHYPGRHSPEEEGIAARQMRGRGGMVSLSLRGGAAAVPRFLHHLRLVQVACSLGGVESLVSVPGETSHRHLTPSELATRGIDEGLVRISLGVEDPDDLLRDLDEALRAAHPPTAAL
ncbi:MAG TPA: PLP-dependent aspartate aminotransferase family protein [Thermoplasmata archaeon]|nr:PLP-dependent aspartate aminotransferase family protein [Thermoplasmata archaeon]